MINTLGNTTSVTRWLDCFSLYGYSQQLKFAQNLKNAKVGLRFYQTQNKPSKVSLRFFKVCPSGKISPNLVTLNANAV